MKSFGYIRCSGVGQLEGDGPTRQRDAIQSFADKHGITIDRWFVESHTGTDLTALPNVRQSPPNPQQNMLYSISSTAITSL